jgi:CRISPR-associated endoribonuclease Cas6/Csy4 subtype I-F
MQDIASLHFVDIHFSAETLEVLPMLLSMVHGYNSVRGNPIGVDFPRWTSEQSTVGESAQQLFRVMGPAAAVGDFFQQSRMPRLSSVLGCSFTVCAVPATSQFAAVSRHNTGNKNKPGHARRLARREAARTGQPVAVSDLVLKHTPSVGIEVPASSKSTGQSFLLKLKKATSVPVAQVEFNAYGLCKAGAVPQF